MPTARFVSTHPRFDAIISDIDGCLGPESHAPLNADALAKLAAHNHRAVTSGDQPIITLCSGRPLPYAEAIARLLGNSLLPVVCEMGVWLYDPRSNEFLRDPAIKPEHLAWVRDATTFIETDLAPRGIVIQPGKSASLSLYHPDTPTLMAIKPTLESRFAREGWGFRISNTVKWINCDLTFISKATGIKRLCEMCGLSKTRLAGIGDTMGDMAIREQVAWFACPQNAEPNLKPSADFVAQGHDVDGVLEIVETASNFR